MCVCLVCVCVSLCVCAQSCLTLCNPIYCKPVKLLCPWDSPGKITGVGCHFLLQWLFPTQGIEPMSLASSALAGRFFTTEPMAFGPIPLWQVDGKTKETVIDFILGGSTITADGDYDHEIKRHFLLGRKAMTNLDSI